MKETQAQARTAAWNMYVQRVEELIASQQKSYFAGESAAGISIAPPSKKCVAILERALENAEKDGRQSVISAALAPVISAIDAIDNSGRKNKRLSEELRASLDDAYEKLYALKSSEPEPPK